jgi:hypothetical protein
LHVALWMEKFPQAPIRRVAIKGAPAILGCRDLLQGARDQGFDTLNCRVPLGSVPCEDPAPNEFRLLRLQRIGIRHDRGQGYTRTSNPLTLTTPSG